MSFWLFIAVIVVASIVNTAFRHYQIQKTIRKAMELGQTLDPQVVERILASERPKGQLPRGGLILGGVLMLAIGAGLSAAGWFMARTDPAQLYQGLGAGSIVGLIGVGLLVAHWLVDRTGKVEE